MDFDAEAKRLCPDIPVAGGSHDYPTTIKMDNTRAAIAAALRAVNEAGQLAMRERAAAFAATDGVTPATNANAAWYQHARRVAAGIRSLQPSQEGGNGKRTWKGYMVRHRSGTPFNDDTFFLSSFYKGLDAANEAARRAYKPSLYRIVPVTITEEGDEREPKEPANG